jgi:uncharacterized membrane protein YdfJ with MMPL/SSD domain
MFGRARAERLGAHVHHRKDPHAAVAQHRGPSRAPVLLDATLIRGVLLPAAMKLLGDRNWWLPRSLGWMPRVEGEREVQPANA